MNVKLLTCKLSFFLSFFFLDFADIARDPNPIIWKIIYSSKFPNPKGTWITGVQLYVIENQVIFDHLIIFDKISASILWIQCN